MPSFIRFFTKFNSANVLSRRMKESTDGAGAHPISESNTIVSLPPLFPQELYDAIIDAIALPGDYASKECLRSCSLVSKSFLPRCRWYTFNKVKLGTSFYLPTSRLATFLSLLVSEGSQLSHFVQELHVQNAFWEPELAHILQLLPNIRSLHLENDPISWSNIPSPLRASVEGTLRSPRLEELSMRGISDFPAVLLLSSPNLKGLTLRECAPFHDSPSSSSLPQGGNDTSPARLQSLECESSFQLVNRVVGCSPSFSGSLGALCLQVTDHDEAEGATRLCHAAAPTLHRIELVAHSDFFPEIDLDRLPALRYLQLELRANFKEHKDGIPSAVMDALSRIPDRSLLETVNIAIQWEDCDPASPWQLHPTNGAWGQLDQILSRLSCLKTVHIGFSVLYDTGKSSWAHEDIMALENAAVALDSHLEKLLPSTRAAEGIMTNIAQR